MHPLTPPIVFSETTDLEVRYLNRMGTPAANMANELVPTDLIGTELVTDYDAFIGLADAIGAAHEATLTQLPDVSILGDPPLGQFPMPTSLAEAQAHLAAARQLNDLSTITETLGETGANLQLHLAGLHRDAAMNFYHYSGSLIAVEGFFTLEGAVINHNQIRGLLAIGNFRGAGAIIDSHFGPWMSLAGTPYGKQAEVDFVDKAAHYLKYYYEQHKAS